MRRSRFMALMAMTAILAFAASGWMWADETPGIRAEAARIDLGKVTAGTDHTATFTLHNDSAADVRILRAKPS